MGTDVHVLVVGGRPGLVVEAGALVLDLERRWSRFRPDSEISRLNRESGRAVRVSPETLLLLRRGIEGARVTGGRFDPTLLGAVIRAGYDRSFDLLSDDAPAFASPLTTGVERIQIDDVASTVTLPEGVGFDPGGIGKGLAADHLVEHLLARGAVGACASIGGDVRVEGEGLDGGGWTIAIEHPRRRDPAALVGLLGGAVATSSRMRRAWGPDRDRRHHLIDPATGAPAWSGLMSATAIAAEAGQAEVLSKAAFVAGLEDGFDVLTSMAADGLLIDDDGEVHTSDGFGRFTGDAAAASTVDESPVPAMAGGGIR